MPVILPRDFCPGMTEIRFLLVVPSPEEAEIVVETGKPSILIFNLNCLKTVYILLIYLHSNYYCNHSIPKTYDEPLKKLKRLGQAVPQRFTSRYDSIG